MPPEPPADSDDEETEQKTPAQKLVSYIHDLYFSTTLKAVHVGTIMYYLTEMGYKDDAGPYATHPSSQSGKFQAKLDTAFGFKQDDKELVDLDLPLRDYRTGRRKMGKIKAQPAHEALAKELDEKIELLENWERQLEQSHGEWVDTYMRHEAVVGASASQRKRILPIVLYMDGAAFAKRDSLLIFTVRWAFSKKRHLVWALRKSHCCNCSCGGWCSLFQLFNFLAYSLQSLRSGKRPVKGFGGLDLDPGRKSSAGQAYGWSGIVVDILGDWKEFAASWGFPTWSAYLPCFMCITDRLGMRDSKRDVVMRRDTEYEEEVAKCEIWIAITTVEIQDCIRFKLQDHQHLKGYCLTDDIRTTTPPLRKGDRLEPSVGLPDIKMIFSIAKPFRPFRVCFWRIGEYTCVHHRNPVISRYLGISYSTFACDVLHCLHLGVFPMWMTRALHVMFACDCFETRASRKDDHLIECALAIKERLAIWYPKYEKQRQSEGKSSKATRVNYFTEHMLGNAKQSKYLKLKAAEARHFCPFVVELVKEFRQQIRDHGQCNVDALLNSGQALLDFMEIIQREPRTMSVDAVRSIASLMKYHNEQADLAGVRMMPKHHQALRFCYSKNLYLVACKSVSQPASKQAPW